VEKRCGITMLPPVIQRAHGRDALPVDVIERQRRQHAVVRAQALCDATAAPAWSMFECVSSTPFGTPVVPEVYISMALVFALAARACIGAGGVEIEPCAATSTIRVELRFACRRLAGAARTRGGEHQRRPGVAEHVVEVRILREQVERATT
jgi:hypothetical protein